jgi:peptide/nickel transport system ATP-binding protein
VKSAALPHDVAELPATHRILADDAPVLQVENLHVQYAHSGGRLAGKRSPVQAVQDVSVHLQPGEVLALVGESGSGKTTLGRCIVGLMRPDTGQIRWHGDDITGLAEQRSRSTLSGLQMVYQMPDTTLNPKHTIGQILERTLQCFGVKQAAERRKQVAELLTAVRLPSEYRRRYPAHLSGGEKQRVAIARAFAASPDVIVCDEAVSALDVSVQAAILNLMIDLKQQTGCAYLFITHDLALVRYLADRVAIMQAGQLVEIGPADRIFEAPEQPYTRRLLVSARTAP